MDNKQILEISIEETLKNSYLDYAMSVIAGRALPDVRDGLKPVHRRVLYIMNEMGLQFNKPNKKSARVVGDVMGKLHPHGDTAIYDALVRLAQDFSMRYPLAIGQGNFGSIDGDSPAAMRYTETRMAKITSDLMADIDSDTVDFIPSYDGSMEEPVVFPTRVPNLLINGISGIAVGMATNIPPHNLTEVMDALLFLVDNPEGTIDDICEIIKGPDFPTSAIVMGRGEVIQAFKTGRGSVKVRARTEIIELKKGGKEQIIITEIPYQVNKASLVEKIAELVNAKKMVGITDIRDTSNRKGIKILIDVRRGESAEVILNRLYKFTALESTFSYNMVALVNGKPQVLGLMPILQAFLAHRVDVVTRRTKYLLRKTLERMHLVEGLKIAVENIDAIVELIKSSPDTATAKKNLISKYELSDIQAQAVLDMRLAKITGLEIDKLMEEYARLLKDIDYYNSLLDSKKKLMAMIRKELEEVKTVYGDVRKTEISNEITGFNMEDLIPNDETIVTITHNGYIKRTLLSNFAAQKRGGKGKTGASSKGEDFVEQLIPTTNHCLQMFFTNRGKVHFLKVYQVPEQNRDSKGRHISNLLTLDIDEKIASILTISDDDNTKCIFFGTKQGVVKRVLVSDFKSGRSGMIALKLREDDEIVSTLLTAQDDDIFITTSQGKAIRFNISEVRTMGRTATGVRGISLNTDDFVVSLEVIKTESQIFAVTTAGRGKCTPVDEYRVQSRGGKGVILMKLDKGSTVVGAKQVTMDHDIMLITRSGKIIRTSVSKIRLTLSRSAKGVSIMNTSGDEIISVAVVTSDINEDEEFLES